MDGLERRLLLRYPVQRIKGNYEIELALEWQTASIRHLKAQVRQSCRTEVSLRKVNHVLRRIDSRYRTSRDTMSDLRRDLPIAASDIQNPFRPVEIEQRDRKSTRLNSSHRCIS